MHALSHTPLPHTSKRRQPAAGPTCALLLQPQRWMHVQPARRHYEHELHGLQVMLEGAIVPLVACLSNKRKSVQLQSTAAAALSDIAKHGPELAARVAEAGESLLPALAGASMWSEMPDMLWRLACQPADHRLPESLWQP